MRGQNFEITGGPYNVLIGAEWTPINHNIVAQWLLLVKKTELDF